MEMGVALTTLALGTFVFIGSFWINLGSDYDRIGPRFFPYVIAAGLILSGCMLARDAFRREHGAQARFPTSRSAIVTLCVALVSSVVLLEHAGFILSSTLLFWLVARSFGSDRRWRDAIVGLLLSSVVYLAFTTGLGLALPRGILAGLF